MSIELTIKNYRCFSRERPVTVTLAPGFTAFIGMNNAGKSAILRCLYEFRDVFRRLGGFSSGDLRNVMASRELLADIQGDVTDVASLFCDGNTGPLELRIAIRQVSQPAEAAVPPSLAVTFQRVAGAPGLHRFEVAFPDGPDAGACEPNPEGLWELRGKQKFFDVRPYQLALTTLAETLYVPAFRNAINVGASERYFDVTVGQTFIRDWHVHKSGPLRASNETAVRVTREIQRLLAFEHLEINVAPDTKALQLVIDDRSRRLDEVGAGIAQLIIVLITAAIRRPRLLLIDEPELNLHPALQVDFLTTLGRYATEGVWFATHSLGLARAVADRTYSLRSAAGAPPEVHRFEETPNLAEFLGSLGFAAIRESGARRLLLVEGPSDVRTLQRFLRLFEKHREFIVLPLGGSTMINADRAHELDEVLRLTDQVFAVIDSERTAPDEPLAPPRQAFVDTCNQLGIMVHVLERRATENYLTTAAIQAVKGQSYVALGAYETLSGRTMGWGKHENWRIAGEMTKDELAATDLGRFLDGLPKG